MDHDETQAMKDVENRHAGQQRPPVTDFDYGNVLDRGQHGPNRDPRLVNSNYALIGTLEGMDHGRAPEYLVQPPINDPAQVEAGLERPPSQA